MALLGNLSMARIFTDKPEESKAFYQDVLEFPLVFSDDTISIFDVGGCQLGVEVANPVETFEGSFSGLSFDVKDIEAVSQSLKDRGVGFVGDPAKQYWGGSLAHFKDPGGNVLTLVEYPKQ